MTIEQTQPHYQPICRIYRMGSKIIVEVDSITKSYVPHYKEFLHHTQQLIDARVGAIKDLEIMLIGQDGVARPAVVHGVECHNGTVANKTVIDSIVATGRELRQVGWVVQNPYDSQNGSIQLSRMVID